MSLESQSHSVKWTRNLESLIDLYKKTSFRRNKTGVERDRWGVGARTRRSLSDIDEK